LRVVLFFLVLGVPGIVQAQDAQRGKQLYENHCLSCHYERIHHRDPSKSLVKSNTQLRVEVAKRGQMATQRFTIEDLDDIAEYLNGSHYRFETGLRQQK
jgi:mono/diheme cytochrome c family protein